MERWTHQPLVPPGTTDASIRDGLRDAKLVLLQIVTAQLTGEKRWLKASRESLESELFNLLVEHRATQATAAPMEKSQLFQLLVQHAGQGMYDEALASMRRPLSQSAWDFLLDEMYGYPSCNADEFPLRDVKDFHVVICGIGVCGLAVSIRLKKAGIPFTVLEGSDGISGTWHCNLYPNVGCDTPTHVYSFASDPNPNWTRYFAKGHENKTYFVSLAEKYGIMKHVLFEHTVESARFDAASSCWEVAFHRGDGSTGCISANVYVSSVGMLSIPKIPQVHGSNFQGKQFHTARWDSNTSLVGKNVAIIGSGASCMQVAPSIAAVATHLTIFQGTPQWCTKIPNYKWEIPEGERWCFANLPFYERWYRFQLLAHFTDIYEEMMTAGSTMNSSLWDSLTKYYEHELAGHPDLLQKATPNYPPACTRLLVDNGWFDLLKRKNVTLISSHVSQLGPRSVIAGNSQKKEVAEDVDVIVWATGFRSTEFCLAAMEVFGVDGLRLGEFWGPEPSAYLGVSVPHFPNFFMTYGPNSNVAAGGSIVWVAENQARYIEQCCSAMIRQRIKRMEVREDVFKSYNSELDKLQGTRVWSDKACTSWYKEGTGKVTTGSPWSLEEYCRRLRFLELRDYKVASNTEGP